ncbi:MAG TPA: thioredoxin family protein [Phycisphaerales bacterium]|nr:thioredoxin family protein [Phycisphaerales bacterium]
MTTNEAQSQSSPSADRSPRPPRRTFFRFWRCFWLTFLVASLAYAWYCYYVPGNDIAWADDYTSAQQLAAESGKPMILYFSGTWCVPCRIMKRQVWADEQVAKIVNAGFVPVTIDVDDPETAAVTSRYRVGATPITIITDAQGNVLQHEVGGMNKADFLELLERVNQL